MATKTSAAIADLLADGEQRTAREIATTIGAGYSTVTKTLAAMEGEAQTIRERVPGEGDKVDTVWRLAAAEADVVDEAPVVDKGREAILDGIAETYAEAAREAASEAPAVEGQASRWPLLIAEVRKHAEAHYEDGGWDYLVECWSDAQIEEVLVNAGASTVEAAIALFAKVVGTLRERELEAGWAEAQRELELGNADLVADAEREAAREAVEAPAESADEVDVVEVSPAAEGEASKATKAGLPVRAKGGLHADVVEWLAANPAEEITPSRLAKALGGRSSGAVANALVRLVRDGGAVETCAKPRTYRQA